MTDTVPVPLPAPDKQSRNFAMLAQLFGVFGWLAAGIGHIVCPLLLYFIKRDEEPFVAFHALQATLFHLLCTVCALILAPILFITCVLAPLIVVGFLVWLFFSVAATVAAARGEWSRFPFVGQWALDHVIARHANGAKPVGGAA